MIKTLYVIDGIDVFQLGTRKAVCTMVFLPQLFNKEDFTVCGWVPAFEYRLYGRHQGALAAAPSLAHKYWTYRV